MKEASLSFDLVDLSGPTLIDSTNNCSQLYEKLPSITFSIQDYEFSIEPQGYTMPKNSSGGCMIGISEVPDDANEFRLGTLFL